MLIFFLLTGLSFKTESRIEFLTPGTGGTKVLGNIPALPLQIKTLLIDDKECCLFLYHFFPLFHYSSGLNFETCLLSPEDSLFVLKVCLLSSEIFKCQMVQIKFSKRLF